MFLLFAQWFTDSFLRTDRSDWRKNTSTQEIDFCQVYGLSEDRTRMLRELRGGRLKSQQINGEEYPPFLFARSPDGVANGATAPTARLLRGSGTTRSRSRPGTRPKP